MNSLGTSYPSLTNETPSEYSSADKDQTNSDLDDGIFTIEITKTLLEISNQLLSTHDIDHLLNKIIRLLSELVAYHTAAIHMVQGDRLYTRAAVGLASQTVGQFNFQKQDDYVWQYLEQEHRPYVYNDTHQEKPGLRIGQERIRSFIAVPLASKGELIGILTIDHAEPHQYGEREVELVRLFADYAAIALENARLLLESNRYIKDLEILQTIATVGVANTNRQTIIEETLHALQDTLGYDLVSMFEVVGDQLQLVAQSNYPVATMNATIKHWIAIETGIMSNCVRARRPILIRDVTQSPKFTATAPDITSVLCVPILVDGRVYGVINVEAQQARKLDESDLRLLTILVNRLGVTFQNLELYEEVNRRLTTVSALYANSLDITSGMDEKELLDAFLERVLTLVNTSIAVIFLYNAEIAGLVLEAVSPTSSVLVKGDAQSKDEGILGRAFRSATPIFESSYARSPYRDKNWPQDHFPLGATGAVPLMVKGKPIGVLGLARQEEDPFDEEEKQVIGLLANHIATAIENHRLFHAEQRRGKQLLLLNEITTTTLETNNFQQTLNHLTNRLGTLINADGCFLLLWDELHQRSTLAASYGPVQGLDEHLAFLETVIVRPVLATGTTVLLDSSSNSEFQKTIDLLSIHAALCLPLQVGEDKIGVAMVVFTAPHTFSDEEMNIGKQAAAQIAVAIAKAKLLEMERRQRQSAEIQLAFSFTLMETTKVGNAVDSLLTTISELVAYDGGSVMLLESDNLDFGYFAAVSGYTDPTEASHRSIRLQDFPLLNQIRTERKEIYFPDIRNNENWRPGHQPDPDEVRSILLVPLLYDQQSKMIGCLTLKSYKAHAFSSEERSNITLLCNQTAGAVRNIRLMEETRRRLNEVSILAEMSETLNRTFELDEMFQLVLDRVMSLLEQSTNTAQLQGSIILRQQPSEVLRLAVGYNLTDDYKNFFNNRPVYAYEGTFKHSILQGEWVALTDVEQIRQMVAVSHADLKINEVLNIPLKVGQEVIGVITANRVATDPLTKRLLGAIAELAGSAIQKTKLLAQARDRAVELMEAYEALNNMDRLREEFIQSMTHDLRAPLTFIRGYTDLMIEGAMGDINEEQREALEVIQERTEAVNRLVGDILKMKQVESQPLKEEPVELVSVASTAVRSALMTARKAGLEIHLHTNVTQAIVRGDGDRLGQVFDNLLSNAIKYNKTGGQIEVTLDQRGPKIHASIADTGIGIPSEELDRIWERYYRARGTLQGYIGTGLGLANVRHIIEAHDGRIWVQSNSKGTTFTFELPLDMIAEQAS